MRDDLIPDASLGTHFFSKIVWMDMLYPASFPLRREGRFNESLRRRAPNKLRHLLPDVGPWQEERVRVIDTFDLTGGKVLKLTVDTLRQKALCYFDPD